MDMMINVEIGPGDNPRPGFKGYDHREHDYDCLFDELPYDDNTVDNIHMSHILEHIPMFKTEEVLLRLYKKLKVSGKLRISVPDLKAFAQAYIDGDLDKLTKNRVSCGSFEKYGIGGAFVATIISFGSDTQLMDRKKERWIIGIAHISAYDFETLSSILKCVGFINIIKSQYTEGVDTNNDECQLFVEATK